MVSSVKSLNNKNKKVKVSGSVEPAAKDIETGLHEASDSDSDDSIGEDLDEDDEVDLDQVSSGESADEEAESSGSEDGEEAAQGESDEEDYPLTKAKKPSKSKHDDGSAAFSSAMTSILSSRLKAYDRADPIMARNKKVLKQTDQDKLDVKAKKALLAEKKRLLNKTRQQDIVPLEAMQATKTLEQERKLRKIAQKGVVKLFNVIMSTQVRTEREVSDKFGDPHAIHNLNNKKKLISEVSKETFLDLVKNAGAEDEDDD